MFEDETIKLYAAPYDDEEEVEGVNDLEPAEDEDEDEEVEYSATRVVVLSEADDTEEDEPVSDHDEEAILEVASPSPLNLMSLRSASRKSRLPASRRSASEKP